MSEMSKLVSKVLVLDTITGNAGLLKSVCEEFELVVIRPQTGGAANVMSILGSNIDLGGILLYENYGGQGQGIELARSIREARPELPIFLRRERHASVVGMSEQEATMFRCTYTFADLAMLRASLDASIFNRIYPTTLVRGITEMTKASLGALLQNCEIDVETPYLVKDRIIYGEVFTLISIESNWCRGYMMLQAAEEDVLALMPRGEEAEKQKWSFRELNGILGEATNMIWGAFKNRYAGDTTRAPMAAHIQVPIIINHQRRFISFGSEDPQLCLKYTLRDLLVPERSPVAIYQRFIFNLNWSPEDMSESPAVDSMFASGELEVF